MKRVKLPERRKGLGLDVKQAPGKGLSGRFIFPPFTVLRASDKDWQRRKRQWIALGIESEVGRGREKELSESAEAQGRLNKFQSTKQGLVALAEEKNEHLSDKERRALGFYISGFNRGAVIERLSGGGKMTGVSIFDPVLCELMYSWFCPPGGQVIDPFAGGSVRGIVAVYMGLRYWGSELRPEQVKANTQQGKDITPGDPPIWVCGDSWFTAKDAPQADFIFSCPPYGNLEVYSQIPGDLSNMDYGPFISNYSRIIRRFCARLKHNRFACFVVSNFRDDKGFYHNLVGDTINAFEDCGLKFYNDMILLTAIGTLPIRAGKYFTASRKLGKTHQNVLVFYKGDDPKEIRTEFS